MDYALARRKMVESQILPNRVTDKRLIEAMRTVPRELFVPKALRGIAYVDEAVPIGRGRHLMEPMVFARLVQAAEIKPTDVVLSVGTGTGYGPAVISRLASTVVALESDPEFARHATETLSQLRIDTVAVVEGLLEKGYPNQAPYDVIYFDGAVSEIPAGIAAQLAEGGRMVAVLADADRRPRMGRGVVVTKFGGALSERDVFDGGTPALPGFAKEPTFVF
ncbi:MAG: protein-L-isoaspartate O-methyltransferase [Rhodospirillales bacterium]|nr:protein-L-isoaspartate O-methyltransferase [Rhodospirillales bacterium]